MRKSAAMTYHCFATFAVNLHAQDATIIPNLHPLLSETKQPCGTPDPGTRQGSRGKLEGCATSEAAPFSRSLPCSPRFFWDQGDQCLGGLPLHSFSPTSSFPKDQRGQFFGPLLLCSFVLQPTPAIFGQRRQGRLSSSVRRGYGLQWLSNRFWRAGMPVPRWV